MGWQVNLAESHGQGQTESVSKYKVERDREMDLDLNSGIQKPGYTQVQLHTRVAVCLCIHTHVHAHPHEDITKCCKNMERKCTEITHYWNIYRFTSENKDIIPKQCILLNKGIYHTDTD